MPPIKWILHSLASTSLLVPMDWQNTYQDVIWYIMFCFFIYIDRNSTDDGFSITIHPCKLVTPYLVHKLTVEGIPYISAKHVWHNIIYQITSWCVFCQSIGTNNDVEGWYIYLIHKASDRKPGFYELTTLLDHEASLILLQQKPHHIWSINWPWRVYRISRPSMYGMTLISFSMVYFLCKKFAFYICVG
jgi:hypothetical protein